MSVAANDGTPIRSVHESAERMECLNEAKKEQRVESAKIRITVIGVGGIGSHLAGWVARLLSYPPTGYAWDAILTLVDGDSYEDRNAERQEFDRAGNKAQAAQQRLKRQFPRLDIVAIGEFLGPENAEFILRDGEVVLLCVDNHPTRKFVSDFVRANCPNVTLISGGNDTKGYGTVYVCLRREGVDSTPPLTARDPAIANPTEKPPWEKTCEELAEAGEPQLFLANLMVGDVMINALFGHLCDPAEFAARAADRSG
ncbi:MAG: ThiF family adenylyltransferase, partial [bacterium]|nr:ThiF family adenylyltransferase [bacterium]